MSDNVIVQALNSVTGATLVIWTAAIITLMIGIVKGIIAIIKWIEKYRQKRNAVEKKDEKLVELEKSVTEIKTLSETQSVALKVILANELNRKYRYYLELGYIPDEEFDEYVDNHDAYKALGGNHTGDAKFNYIMEHLERKVNNN